MRSETTEKHKKLSSNDITCGIITLSDTITTNEDDLSGQYLANELSKRYQLKSKIIIPDEKKALIESIEKMIENNIEVILTTGGTGLDSRDITVETVESIFDKKIEGFGEIFRHQSFLEIGSGALISRATAGVYKKTVIFSMPGSPNAVKTALNIIIDEFPHLVFHAQK
ncbi:molybdenum cofactor biosynthesis protein B [uncultured Methanobrevibacter sp.]|uniref:MogA/MoaB family molybdenum cofactor biosynthesis protein n=1 Tax=uncultured Methanobrevibacter sp. TaxID=253161 RepID=UPI00261B1FE4|nr:MogA/MoaB family molybdenum cofactor biosynthesis protein [uncultured Methanobrevibacter sp.]